MKRRDFFREAFGETLRGVYRGADALRETYSELSEGIQDAMDGTEGSRGDFFDSYELSYSLTLAYPRELFEQIAREQGIVYEGVETIDLARELNRKGII